MGFSAMFFGSWIALNRMEKYGVTRAGSPVDYDEDLNRSGLSRCVLASVGIFLVSMIFTGLFGQAVLYVPKSTMLGVMETAFATVPVLTRILNELLYQTFVVAAAEESMKLSAMIGLTWKFRSSANEFLRSKAREAAAAIVVGFWALLHAILAYSNVYMTVAAFVAGLILLWQLFDTKSILAPIVTHGPLYNAILQIIKIVAGSV